VRDAQARVRAVARWLKWAHRLLIASFVVMLGLLA
jgi:hypothetical protein